MPVSRAWRCCRRRSSSSWRATTSRRVAGMLDTGWTHSDNSSVHSLQYNQQLPRVEDRIIWFATIQLRDVHGRVGLGQDFCILWRVGSKILEIHFCLLFKLLLFLKENIFCFILLSTTHASRLQDCSLLNTNYCKNFRSKTANVTKDDITLQHIDKMSLCCEVISSFVIFAVLDLRVGGCRP